MKPLDLMGLGPRRQEEPLSDNTWRITVTPPTWSHFSASSVILTADQYRRYLEWRDTGMLIQEALPDLSADQREIIMTGIGPEEFAELGGEDQDSDT